MSIASLWPSALVMLLALVPGATYVSLINDLTDRDEDQRAGKPDRVSGREARYITLILVTVVAGIAFCVAWRDDVLLLSVYLAAWLAFSLYSLPPFRWKTRGILGVLCDASGAHLFPTLVAVVLAFRGAGQRVDPLWFAAIALWAFGNGVRGIIWHQLTDVENDRIAGVRTFAQRHPRGAAVVGTAVAFPLEITGLTLMLWMMKSPIVVGALIAYASLVVLRRGRWGVHAIVVRPAPRFHIALHEYYDAFLPMALLLASAVRHPRDLAALAIHLALFPSRPRTVLDDCLQLWRERRYPWMWTAK